MRDHICNEKGVWLAVLWTMSSAGCFFTDSVNSEPQAQVETTQAGFYYRGDTVSFDAHKSDDPNGDTLTVDWRAFTCSPDRSVCDAPAFKTLLGVDKREVFSVEIPYRRESMGVDAPTLVIAVEATVTDSRGASHAAREFVDVLNATPTTNLQVQGARAIGGSGYPLGSFVRIVAASSDPEGDAVTHEWSYRPANGSMLGEVRWSMVDQTTYELEPDVEGLWTVEVTSTDEVGDSATFEEPINIIPDRLPCIASTEPPVVEGARYIVDRDAAARRFAVLNVSDDLDAHPPRQDELFGAALYGRADFRWFVSTPDTEGVLVEVTSHDVPDYLLNASVFSPGDQLSLRVEIDDRAGRDIICGALSATCSLSADSCLQRVTWDMEVR